MTDTTDKDLLAVEAERVLAAARDSLSDEMVTRLAGAASDGIDLIDRVNRSGLHRAIPAIAELVNNGDLDRLARLARVYGAAEDSLSDEMVGRLAETVAEGMSLLDRLNRGGAGHLVEMLAQLEADGNVRRIADTMPRILQKLETIEQMLHAFEAAAEATAKGPRATGGLGGMLTMLRDPENQEALRYLTNVGKALASTSRR